MRPGYCRAFTITTMMNNNQAYLLLRKHSRSMSAVLLLLLLFLPQTARSQHYIGIREGYSISGVGFNPAQRDTSTSQWLNMGLVYRYYNSKWVGLQTGINYSEKGFIWNDTTRRYRVLELPLVSQFHAEIWHLRLLANAGAYMSYALSGEKTIRSYDGTVVTSGYEFGERDRRFDYGLHLGAGLGFVFDPFELQFEFAYQYAFSYVMTPQVPGQQTLFTHFHQMIFSAVVLYRL